MSASEGSFTHLHLHTEFSMLDGAARIKEVVKAAAADGQPAIGITDHGNMYGVLDFYAACKDAGIKPIIGSELYMAAESRHERPTRRGRVDDTGGDDDAGEKLYYHLIAHAETNEGYRNLLQISSRAYLEGFYYKPRCFAPWQEIVTRHGVKQIKDIEIGDEVLTHKGRFRKVTRLMSNPHKGEIYGIKPNNRYRRTVWMTGEHPVLIRNEQGELNWVEAKDIKPGRARGGEFVDNWNSWVCFPKLDPSEPEIGSINVADYVSPWEWSTKRAGHFTKATDRGQYGLTYRHVRFPETLELDYNLGRFIGLFVAEGCVYRSQVSWYLHEDEQELIDHCAIFAEKLVGKPAIVHHRTDREQYRGIEVRVQSALLAELLTKLCGKGARNKHLPAFVWDAPREFQAGVVDGVLDGDGSYHDDATVFCQTSKNLAWQVRTLRATLADDFACVAEKEMDHEAHAMQYVSNFSPRSRSSSYRRTLSDDRYVYRPVGEVKIREFDGTVYNFEVEDDHSYVSDFVVHNCDFEILSEHSKGVIATTGCLGGITLQALLQGNEKLALERAGKLQDIFGRDNLFVELQDHGLAEQKRTNPMLVELARKLKAPLLATNDSHYTTREDHLAHDALLCVQTGSTIDDPKRFKFDGDEHYLKSAREMRELFKDYPEACDNSLWIAERANVDIEFGKVKLPEFPRPPEFATASEFLRSLTFEKARARYCPNGGDLPSEVIERLEYELGVIENMGFSDYFLVVWDLIRFAKEEAHIRCGPGRGSAAGCCVAYCLGIVDIDPIKYDLLFERFLNPGRKQMPDIDMDFDERYRGEMIKYAARRYGWDCVAQIVTFSTIKARAAVRDASRVLGFPYAVGDRIAKLMPPLIMGRDTPLYACLEPHPKYDDGYKMAGDLRELYASDPEAKKVIDVAKGLEGLRRQDGIHAAAVVITNDPLTEYLPIQRKPAAGENPEDAPVVTQYEMHGVEDLGLLKMDFLGLRNLSVIERTLDLIGFSEQEKLGPDADVRRFDVDNIPLDDEKTLEMLRKGDSIGVFQLEGGPMRALMRALAPTSFDDVAALIALYRPGPMAANMHMDYADRKNGRKPIEYIHPDLEEVLGDTYGLMIYQELLMRTAQKVAGYSLEQADNLRKACGKKNREIIAKERESFVEGCERTGYGRDLGTKLFDIIEPFADYAFNKSHAYGYGFVSYQTAYLKAHFPTEYLAALLTSVKDDKDKTAVYLSECRNLGIEVLVPDVNKSESDFVASHPDDKTLGVIPFGLSGVRNVGEGLVEKIIDERTKNGPFVDFYDFCQRVDTSVLNKRSIESLIKAGGFDSLGHPRQGLLLAHEQIIDATVARRREHDAGVMSLFGAVGDDEPLFDDTRVPIPDVEFDKTQRLAFEKEMLGLYVSDHPLMGAESALRKFTDCSLMELREMNAGDMRVVGGIITNLNKRYTKRGDLMATFVLEDLQSAIECWVFPRTMQEWGSLLVNDAIVCVKGRIDDRDDQVKLVAMEISRPELVLEGGRPLRLGVPVHRMTDRLVDDLKKLLSDHPGDSPVILEVDSTSLRLPAGFNVDSSNGLMGELRVLLGADCVIG